MKCKDGEKADLLPSSEKCRLVRGMMRDFRILAPEQQSRTDSRFWRVSHRYQERWFAAFAADRIKRSFLTMRVVPREFAAFVSQEDPDEMKAFLFEQEKCYKCRRRNAYGSHKWCHIKTEFRQKSFFPWEDRICPENIYKVGILYKYSRKIDLSQQNIYKK